MNDNEIIKALECCVIIDGCKQCPRNENGKICRDYNKFIKAISDLINRQKAEIERLKKIRAELSKEIESLKIELQAMREAANSYKANLETAKSVAIREFVEIVKAEDFDRCIDIAYDGSGEVKRAEIRRVLFNKQIDNLVKEMTEGGNG